MNIKTLLENQKLVDREQQDKEKKAEYHKKHFKKYYHANKERLNADRQARRIRDRINDAGNSLL